MPDEPNTPDDGSTPRSDTVAPDGSGAAVRRGVEGLMSLRRRRLLQGRAGRSGAVRDGVGVPE